MIAACPWCDRMAVVSDDAAVIVGALSGEKSCSDCADEWKRMGAFGKPPDRAEGASGK